MPLVSGWLHQPAKQLGASHAFSIPSGKAFCIASLHLLNQNKVISGVSLSCPAPCQ
jgi:hypothetical protein